MTAVDQLFLQGLVILDNTVVDDGKVFRLGIMRMGIGIIGFTVGCPACMGHAQASRGIFILNKSFEIGNLAAAFKYIQALVEQGNTCTVVSSVFQSFESFNKNGIGFPGSDIANNSTHG